MLRTYNTAVVRLIFKIKYKIKIGVITQSCRILQRRKFRAIDIITPSVAISVEKYHSTCYAVGIFYSKLTKVLSSQTTANIITLSCYY